MRILFSPQYWLARFAFQRCLALIYLLAFLAAYRQFCPLLGEHGLLPVPEFLKTTHFRRAPSLFHWRYTDRLLRGVALCGIVLSSAAALSLSERGPLWASIAVWAALYFLYLSIVNVGQIFYAFGWETMLLEAGATAVLLGANATAVPVFLIYLLRWMLFRVEFGAGLIKLRGDPCWRALTCMNYHHETQPLPNPLSSYFHFLPRWFHKLEVIGNFAAQLVVPWGLFLPQPVAGICGAILILTQLWLFTSGNYSWLNLLTMVLALSSFSNGQLRHVLRLSIPAVLHAPELYVGAVLALTSLAVVLSYWPIHNLLSRRQMMNQSFNRYHLMNTYGAFGSVTRERYEIIIEGTEDAAVTPQTQWKEYGFKAKPGDPRRRPQQIAPYHLRLDWLMWFAAMSSRYIFFEHPWFLVLAQKLLQNDAATLGLLARNPFAAGRGPKIIRARLYHYRFANGRERHATGEWWVRSFVGEYLPAVSLPEKER